MGAGAAQPDAWRALLAALDAGSWTCDMRVHLRWEAYNLDALETAIADIEAGRVHLLAFNDHTPSILKKLKDPVEGAKYSGRAGMKMDAFRAHGGCGRRARRRGAGGAGPDRRGRAGSRVCRWPATTMTASRSATVFARWAPGFASFRWRRRSARRLSRRAISLRWAVPNVVRGGSHLGWASAARLAEAGICTVLTSDYYYPAMMRAAFVLAERGVLDLPRAWALISENPARAGGLTDRGTIEAGKRADLVLVDPATSRAVATIAGGRIAYLTAAGSQRLSAG